MNRRVLTCAGALVAATAILVNAQAERGVAAAPAQASRAAAAAPIADAAMRGDKAAVRTLLQKKADVNAPQVDGATALHWAIYRDDEELVDLLIRSGANIKAANRDGATPLAMAALYGKPSI